MGFHYTSRFTLPEFCSGPGPAERRAMQRMAQHGGDRMVDWTIRNTPVDTRNLRTSWYQKPVTVGFTVGGDLYYESGVATDVDYAPHVEHGTGLWGPKGAKYRIRAKGRAAGGADYLRFVVGGQVVFAKEVWHPGSPGNHMVAIAAAMTEAQMDTILRPILERWKREREGGYVGVRLRGVTDFPQGLSW